jgi:formyl-CoA transferase
MIAANSSGTFGRLMTAIDRDDLATDPPLAAGDTRYARRAELDTAITGWTARHSAVEVVRVLNAAGVPVGPVCDASAIAADECYRARQMLRPLDVVVDGEPEMIRIPVVVPTLPGAPGDVRWAGPDLGAHIADVLGGLLRIPDDQLADYARKVV